jgi:hypothetical protein
MMRAINPVSPACCFLSTFALVLRMKTPLTICLLLVTGIVFSQAQVLDFAPVSKKAQAANVNDPGSLSYQLTSPYSTEKEKVRSIFRWITEHISYYRNTPQNTRRKRINSFSDEDWTPDTGALKPLTERIAISVLKERRTYCDGYSRLFKSLCDHAGIRSEIITGYARADIERAEEKFRSNHSWNAVYIDSGWHLLDVTWASGYISRSSDEFVKHYDDYYFLTPPEQFIRHHYPDDLRWTLLKNPPPLYEFRYTPFKHRSYVKYEITDFFPSRGTIEANIGDTIYLELQTNNGHRFKSIAPDSLWDSAVLVISPVYSYVNPDRVIPGKKITYHYPVESDQVQWLHVMYNNDAVLRYRLKINAASASAKPVVINVSPETLLPVKKDL